MYASLQCVSSSLADVRSIFSPLHIGLLVRRMEENRASGVSPPAVVRQRHIFTANLTERPTPSVFDRTMVEKPYGTTIKGWFSLATKS